MIIKSIRCVDYKAFEDRTFEFGSVNEIYGENYIGKTTISESIVTALLGTTLSGSPQVAGLIRRGAKRFELTCIFEVDGETHEVFRSRDSKKTTIQLDGNPATQAEIDRFIGSKERFLTVFVPGYFSSLPNPTAREMVIALSKRPKPEDILSQHSGIASVLSTELAGLRDPDGLAKRIRAEIKEHDAELKRIEGRIEVYHEQLRATTPNSDVEPYDAERLASLREQLVTLKTHGTSHRIGLLQVERDRLLREYKFIDEEFETVPDVPHQHGDPCPVCQRPLSGEDGSLHAALDAYIKDADDIDDRNAERHVRKEQIRQKGQDVAAQIKTLEAADNASQIAELEAEIAGLERLEYASRAAVAKLEQHEQMKRNAAECIAKEEQDKANLENVMFELSEKLKAIAVFRRELAKTQVASVGQYLNRVSIELFKLTQDGEIKDDFDIAYDGKPFDILSTSERIRANLEIATLFNKALGLDFPVFIDNAESITHYDPPFTSQVFDVRVVAGVNEIEMEARDTWSAARASNQ